MKKRKFKVYGSLFVAVAIVTMIAFAASSLNESTAVSNIQLAGIYGGAEICQYTTSCGVIGWTGPCPGPGCSGTCKKTMCQSSDAECNGSGDPCDLTDVYCCITATWECELVAEECKCNYDSAFWDGYGHDC